MPVKGWYTRNLGTQIKGRLARTVETQRSSLSQFYVWSLVLQTAGIVASLATEAPDTSCRSPGRSRWTRCSLQSTSIGPWWNMATRGTMFSLVQLCTKMVQLGINFNAKTGLLVNLDVKYLYDLYYIYICIVFSNNWSVETWCWLTHDTAKRMFIIMCINVYYTIYIIME